MTLNEIAEMDDAAFEMRCRVLAQLADSHLLAEGEYRTRIFERVERMSNIVMGAEELEVVLAHLSTCARQANMFRDAATKIRSQVVSEKQFRAKLWA